MKRLSEFLIGLVFGTGLILSGMSNPAKVIGFLDISGLWDPSLAFVMGGAVLVALIAFRVARQRTQAFFGDALKLPTATQLDKRLIVGSLLFGVGWGLAGFCPGPAIVSLGAGYTQALVFVIAMVAGMLVFELANPDRR
ncbi:MAG: DUF6691 family protein [Burkholderiaceae bacterium]